MSTSDDVVNQRCISGGYYTGNLVSGGFNELWSFRHTGAGPASLYIGGNQVLTATSLASSVTTSSLTSLGTLSAGLNISSGQTYKINSVDVLSSSTLGSSVTTSSLTSLGTLSAGLNISSGQTYKINGVDILSATALASSVTSAAGLKLSSGASPFVIETASATNPILQLSYNSGASIWTMELNASSKLIYRKSSSTWCELSTSSLNLSQSGMYFAVNGTQVVQSQDNGLGGYTAFSGTLNRSTSYDTNTVTLVQLAERVASIQDSLQNHHGLIG